MPILPQLKKKHKEHQKCIKANYVTVIFQEIMCVSHCLIRKLIHFSQINEYYDSLKKMIPGGQIFFFLFDQHKTCGGLFFSINNFFKLQLKSQIMPVTSKAEILALIQRNVTSSIMSAPNHGKNNLNNNLTLLTGSVKK